MLGYCTDYLATMPDITVYMNCDTRLAINLDMFNLGEQDEFIFTIKNFNYIDSSYVFMYRAKKSDIDKNGEIIFKIDPDISKAIKPGAFYNFAVLLNAYDEYLPTEYRKLTENGRITIEYGAQELTIAPSVEPTPQFQEILAAHLEPVTEDIDINIATAAAHGAILDIHLEELR